MCHACYSASLPKKEPVPATCHPEKNAYRKGLCSVCYAAQKSTPSTCHPEEPAHAKGLCFNCYIALTRTPEKTKANNDKPSSVAARKAYAATDRGKAKAAESQERCDPDGSKMAARSRKSYDLHIDERLDPVNVRRANLSRYGLTPADYDRMLEEQGGVCDICKTSDPSANSKPGMSFHVDHCHDTDKVRGLLCTRCNPGLGFFLHDEALLEAALAYIRKHKAA